jgi:hypothetical protein
MNAAMEHRKQMDAINKDSTNGVEHLKQAQS